MGSPAAQLVAHNISFVVCRSSAASSQNENKFTTGRGVGNTQGGWLWLEVLSGRHQTCY